jgi:N-acetylglucosaminyldiphosphoundecaprenol N-acetyl-beta-D-mannosaminyltransferase
VQRIEFFSCPVDSVNTAEALAWMGRRIQERQAGIIAVVNANKFWLMSRDARLQRFMQGAELVIPEWAVVWGAARCGMQLKSYVAGVALLQAAMPWAEAQGYRPYFLGGRPEVIDALSKRLKTFHPGLEPAGFHHGYLRNEADQQEVRAQIRESHPDLVFVGMGSPKQEYWIEENAKALRVPVAMGVGGSFDVLAGLKPDTPSWARGRGLEWLYRLAQDPAAYWKRYLVCNSWFIWQVFSHAVRGVRHRTRVA